MEGEVLYCVYWVTKGAPEGALVVAVSPPQMQLAANPPQPAQWAHGTVVQTPAKINRRAELTGDDDVACLSICGHTRATGVASSAHCFGPSAAPIQTRILGQKYIYRADRRPCATAHIGRAREVACCQHVTR